MRAPLGEELTLTGKLLYAVVALVADVETAIRPEKAGIECRRNRTRGPEGEQASRDDIYVQDLYGRLAWGGIELRQPERHAAIGHPRQPWICGARHHDRRRTDREGQTHRAKNYQTDEHAMCNEDESNFHTPVC